MLRHKPDAIGIALDQNGWTSIDTLLEKMELSSEELEYVVENNSKKRFAISEDGKMIRANQGHSVEIDINLESKIPPRILFHGTTGKNYDIIKREGISKMRRNHVHLSKDVQTANQVGARHGKPIILRVDSERMHADKIKFYQSENGVWLTDYVAPEYISLMGDVNS